MKRDDRNRQNYRQIIALAFPIIVQNLLSAMVSSADVVMLQFVGQSAISAVSLATQYTNILFMFFYGLGAGVTMLGAQYFGRKDYQTIRNVEGIALRISILAAGAFSLAVLCIPEFLMRIYTSDPELIRLGSVYLRYMAIAYMSWSFSEIYLAALRSIGKTLISMILNITAFGMNIVLNAVFIFGLFGAPKMGVAGVALATALSRVIELAGCLLVSAREKEIKLRLSYMFLKNRLLFSDFLRLSVPAVLNDIVWGLAFSMYSVIMGHISSDVVAANAIVTVARNFGTVMSFGMASAASIRLGAVLGEGRIEEAREDGKRLLRLTILTGAIGGILVGAASPLILRYSGNLTETAHRYLKGMLLINTYYIMGQSINTTMICGLFRAGGDSRFGLICDIFDMWCYAVPLGFLTAFVFKLPVMWVYFFLCTDEFAKWPWVFKRYRSGIWLKNITRDEISQTSAKQEG